MVARAEHIGALFVREHGANRQAAAQRLRGRDDVGLYPVLLIAEEAARAADAGLHLIDEQEHVALRAEIAQRLDKRGVERMDAALALDQLDKHRARVFVHRGLHRFHRRLRVGKALGKRRKVVMERVLARRGKRCDRAAVERIFQRHDFAVTLAVVVRAVLARELNRALVGLGAAVCEEHALHAGNLAQQRGRLNRDGA